MTQRRQISAGRANEVFNFGGMGAPGDLVHVEITAATSQTHSGDMSLVARAAR